MVGVNYCSAEKFPLNLANRIVVYNQYASIRQHARGL